MQAYVAAGSAGNQYPEWQASSRLINHQYFSMKSADASRTTPWSACVPKCVVAGPPKTSVMFAFGSEYLTSSPPVTQTCSVDEGGVVSKGALFPFPVNRLTVV